MEVIIESTKGFESDIAKLNKDEKTAVIETINSCVGLFSTNKIALYNQLRQLALPSLANGYDSSLYTLPVSKQLTVILTIDEDPIFQQNIFTLFRVINDTELDTAYKELAEFLYQELLYKHPETAQII